MRKGQLAEEVVRLQGALADQVEAAKAQRQDLEKLQQVGGADSEGRLVALEHAALGSGGGRRGRGSWGCVCGAIVMVGCWRQCWDVCWLLAGVFKTVLLSSKPFRDCASMSMHISSTQ